MWSILIIIVDVGVRILYAPLICLNCKTFLFRSCNEKYFPSSPMFRLFIFLIGHIFIVVMLNHIHFCLPSAGTLCDYFCVALKIGPVNKSPGLITDPWETSSLLVKVTSLNSGLSCFILACAGYLKLNLNCCSLALLPTVIGWQQHMLNRLPFTAQTLFIIDFTLTEEDTLMGDCLQCFTTYSIALLRISRFQESKMFSAAPQTFYYTRNL